MSKHDASQAFGEFAGIIKALRTPGTGCPWDLEQSQQSLRPFLVEETYEVLEAIDDGDDLALREELGDLLLQIVLHAQIADDRGAFSILEVIQGIAEKMVRRHPHVFGSTRVSGVDEVLGNWEKIKAAEKRDKGIEPSTSSALGRLPEGLPALMRAQRLGAKAAKVLSESATLEALFDKTRQQFAELEEKAQKEKEVPSGQREREIGELLFGICQLAGSLGVSAEDSLRACTKRFESRFRRLEALASRPLQELSREELTELQKALEAERAAAANDPP